MTYPARYVANALLWKARQEGAPLTHMKLQKLTFFVHAWSLALKGKGVVNGGFEAWNYGPVSSLLYHELKHFGSQPVTNYLVEVDPSTGNTSARVPARENTEFWSLVDQVWDRYGKMSAAQLSTLSHEPGGPWEKTRTLHKNEGSSFYDIPDRDILTFYSTKLTKQV